MADQGFAAHGGWPVILGTLMEGGDLDADTARVTMAEILDGAASPAQIAAFIVALRMKGETVTELGGMVDAMLDASTRVEIDTSGPGHRRGRHRRRPGPHDQREHHLRPRGRRRRRAGVQARQPGGVVRLRRRRPARGPRRRHRARPDRRGGLRGRSRHRVLLRAPLPPGHAPRRAVPARPRHPHRLQHPRAALQPRPGASGT